MLVDETMARLKRSRKTYSFGNKVHDLCPNFDFNLSIDSHIYSF